MRNLKTLFAVAAIVVFASVATIAATYTQTLLNDGTNVWSLVSSDSSAVSQVALKNGTTTVMTVDPVNGLIVLSGLVAGLPSCTTALKGAIRMVTDGSTTTPGGTLAGSGSATVLGACNGTNWIVI